MCLYLEEYIVVTFNMIMSLLWQCFNNVYSICRLVPISLGISDIKHFCSINVFLIVEDPEEIVIKSPTHNIQKLS